MSKQIIAGGVAIGGGAPVTIQSMCNTHTEDAKATIAQIHALEEAGCEIVRVTVPNMEAAHALSEIKENISIPLVADIHFDYRLAVEAAARGADKIRINPGNIGGDDRVKAVVDACREHKVPIRIGVNGGSLEKERILYVGAGEMIELCAAHFGAQKPAAITVANRSIERGQVLAARHNGTAMRLQDLPEVIADYDIIVSCTASALPIIGLGMIERAVKKRNHRPICIIDLAVPRDVEPEVARLDDVYVYTMDELGAVVQSGKESRQAAVIQAESYINKAVEEFNRWLAMRAVVPSISRIRERADFIRRQELDRALKEIAAGKDTAKVLDDLSLSLTHKLIHDPTVLIRNAEGLTDVEREHITNIVGRFYRPRTV